jgi:hypothetical protein
MEGYCSTGKSPQRAVVPMEEEEGNNTWIMEIVATNINLTISYEDYSVNH